jgi:hypothetical protein
MTLVAGMLHVAVASTMVSSLQLTCQPARAPLCYCIGMEAASYGSQLALLLSGLDMTACDQARHVGIVILLSVCGCVLCRRGC